MTESGVGGREAGARESGKLAGRAGPGSGWQEEERAGEGGNYWVRYEGMWRGTGHTVEGGGGGRAPIRFGTYNIRNGWNGRLESAFRGMTQVNVNVGVFQETKLTEGI